MEERTKITVKEVEEAAQNLLNLGVSVEIYNVEVTMAETRQSPTHGQYSSNKGGVTLGCRVAVDATAEDSGDKMEAIITSLVAEAGHNLQRVMSSMS